MKASLKHKGPGCWVNFAAAAFAAVGMVAYAIAGRDSYGFVAWVEVLLALGIVSAIVFGVRDFLTAGPVVTAALFGGAVGVFLNSRFMYYSHQFYGIASDPITGAMVVTTIALAGMLLLEIVSGFMRWEGKEGQK